MELLQKIREFISNYPLSSVLGAISPLALITIRKFYLEYFSIIEIEIFEVKLLERALNRKMPSGHLYFSVSVNVKRKTRKEIFLEPIQCRIITDSVTTEWHRSNWISRKITLKSNVPILVNCDFFEKSEFNIYQFEVRVKEVTSNTVWIKKSKKFLIRRNKLIVDNQKR